MVTQNYEGLTEPVKEYYPQMKTGFKLFKGDYVPQDGFSAHCKPKGGRFIDFQTCADIVTETRKQPCVIIGQPGSGKTIMMKRLARTFFKADQHERDQPMPKSFRASMTSREGINYDVVLHINIRDIPNTDCGTLAEVIFSPSITRLTTSEAQYGLESILNKKTRIIMFFDGLDQATWEPNCDIKIGPWETASTATIFGNILAGHLLSEVPITVSSREHSVAGLQQNMRPQFIAALAGFSEDDALELYCEIMGEGAEDDWSSMRMSNPAMHYMCLTPVFLIFYMITRKANPEDPPDCATGVMVSIIQIFLECENSRKIDGNAEIIELLNNLKKMAFQGTKEKRVVFDDEDLKRFNLSYEVISDIIIKVPGLSILGQKIFEGMFRFFFSHQTLQEILSALRVVELDYTNFTDVVDEEFQKPYWSVVRSFTCGILMNEGIGNKITKIILRPISDLKKKREYLMTHLQQQLFSDGSPANRLETFVALKEANALDILRGLIEDLDFSNMPLTPAMINTLCSVVKYIGEVRRLSLANSGMDEELLNVFVKGTRGLGIKVAILDIRGNEVWKDSRQWRAIFENMTISECFMDVSSREETGTDVKILLNIVNAASTKYAGQLNFGQMKKIRSDIEQFLQLAETKVRIQLTIDELVIRPGVTSFKLDVWRRAFRRMPFTVQHFSIENPLANSEGEVDVDLWIAAARAVNIVNGKKVSLRAEKVSLTIRQVKSINDSKFGGEIDELYIRAEGESIQVDVWRQIFQKITFIVQHCFVESPSLNKEGKVDIQAWIDASEAANVLNVKKVSLTSTKNNSLTINKVEAFTHSQFRGKIDELYIKAEGQSIQVDVWRKTFQEITFTVQHCFVESPLPNEKGKVDIPAWIDALKAARVGNVKNVYLMSKKIFMSLSEVASINQSGFGGEIDELVIRPEFKSFKLDVWRQAFQRMTFTVNHCFIENPLTHFKGKVDVDLWITAARAANVLNVKKVSLWAKKVFMTFQEVKSINDSKFSGEIHSLNIDEWRLSGDDWRQLGEVTRNFNVAEIHTSISHRFLYQPVYIPDVRSFVEGHGNVKVKKIVLRKENMSILDLYKDVKQCFHMMNAESKFYRRQAKSLAIELPWYLLWIIPQDVGRLIRESDPNDNQVVISGRFTLFDISKFSPIVTERMYRRYLLDRGSDIDEFSSGLNGFKIKELLIKNVPADVIVNLVHKCSVENLSLHEDYAGVFDKIRGLTNVTILSRDEFKEEVERGL